MNIIFTKTAKRILIKRLSIWIILILYMGCVYSLSAQEGWKSDRLSKGIVRKAGTYISFLDELQSRRNLTVSRLNHVLRKSGHFIEYFILTLLIYSALAMSGIKPVKRLIYAFLISAAFAMLDEFHQAFVPGRGPGLTDVGIDVIGAVSALAVLHRNK